MTWPQVTLVGDADFTYTGQTVEPKLVLEPEGGTTISEHYGAVDMSLDNLVFESRNKTWGLAAHGLFTFHEKENEFNLDVPDLFFTIDNEAQFENHASLKTGLTGYDNSQTTIGGAHIMLNQASALGGTRSLAFTHDATLDLGAELNGSSTTVGYNITPGGSGTEGVTSEGPIIGPLNDSVDVVLTAANSEVANARLKNITYIGGGTMTAGCGSNDTLLARNFYSPVASDGWQDFDTMPLLLAGTPGGADLNPCANDTFSAEVDNSLLGSSSTFGMRFRYGVSGSDTYWMMLVNAETPYMPVFSGVFVKFKKGGLGYNLPSDAILAGAQDCTGPDGSGLRIAGRVGLKVVDESLLTGDTDLILSLNQYEAEMRLSNIRFLSMDMGNSEGRIKLSSSAFDGTFNVDTGFLNDAVKLTGEAGIRLAEDWRVYIGGPGREDYVTARFFDMVEGSGMFWFDSSSYKLGAYFGYDIGTPKVFGCKAALGGNMSGVVDISLPSLNFSGSLLYDTSVTFENPIKDLHASEDLSVGFGCCSPLKLQFSWSKSVCVVEGGFSLKILPGLDFNPWVHGKCCFCP